MMKAVEGQTMVGHTLANRYHILETVGTGGMAVVYLSLIHISEPTRPY